MIRKPLNPHTQGIARTIKANYHKQSLANFTRGGSMGATGVIEYEEDTRQKNRGNNLQGGLLPILGGGLISVKVKVSSTVDYMIFQQPYCQIIITRA